VLQDIEAHDHSGDPPKNLSASGVRRGFWPHRDSWVRLHRLHRYSCEPAAAIAIPYIYKIHRRRLGLPVHIFDAPPTPSTSTMLPCLSRGPSAGRKPITHTDTLPDPWLAPLQAAPLLDHALKVFRFAAVQTRSKRRVSSASRVGQPCASPGVGTRVRHVKTRPKCTFVPPQDLPRADV